METSRKNHQSTSNPKIDFVINWVDPNDPQWQKEKSKYDKRTVDATNSINRYRDYGLLKYLFRGIDKFTPWVNRVYLVTCGQSPKWLNEKCPKLVQINHKDYIPKEYLPTFNSSTIELFYHRIEELSQNFVFFNDDMYITNPIEPEYFFENGLPKDSLSFDAVAAYYGDDIIDHIIINNLSLLSNEFPKKKILKEQYGKILSPKNGKQAIRSLLLMPWRNHTGIYNPHLPIAFKKETYDTVWIKHRKELESSITQFRDSKNYTCWVFRYYQLLSGQFVPKSYRHDHYCNVADDIDKVAMSIQRQRYNLLCINDSDENIDFETVKNKLQTAFEVILPEKSIFEK